MCKRLDWRKGVAGGTADDGTEDAIEEEEEDKGSY
jgi:hypothetical protein